VTCADVPGATGSAPSALLNQFVFRASSGSRFAALVIACESNIDQENVDRWESDGVLFTPARSQGLIPGEGAAGLLLMDLDSIKSQPGSVYALLDPFVETRRDVSIDENKRTDMKPLAGLVERACKQAAIEIEDVGMIVADTGERANRTLELMGLASAALPQLESSSDVACVGASSGTCGAVPYLTALALAQHHALERGAPVLCISNEDARHCCVTLVRPASSRS
jgi:3-oxoacyl-(acyl-carrier-protein) synthase